MAKSYAGFWLLLTIVVAGCATQGEILAAHQDMAMQSALTRARFDMNCPDATGVVLSKEVVQPAIQGPMVGGFPRAEYTIGVKGCDKRHTYVVICPDQGDGCFAAGPGRFLQDESPSSY